VYYIFENAKAKAHIFSSLLKTSQEKKEKPKRRSPLSNSKREKEMLNDINNRVPILALKRVPKKEDENVMQKCIDRHVLIRNEENRSRNAIQLHRENFVSTTQKEDEKNRNATQLLEGNFVWTTQKEDKKNRFVVGLVP